ncbi:MAG TPA: glycosyltransferase [Vicinamibacteria bacterium]|nr:glycosyltransferase [Vicinamibacteria bacterium]
MRALDVSVVVPCFNEAKNLPELVERLGRVFDRKEMAGEVVLVDDGSADDTGAVIRALAAAEPRVVGVFHETNRGIAAAWLSGVTRARGDYVCFIDADLQNLPEDVWRLYREIRLSHADVVQGCRSSVGRLKDSRYLLSKGLNALLNTLFGMSARDNKSGFVIGLRETMADILHHRYRYRYFQTFITVAARAKGYTVREVETLFESRLLGRSFMSRFPLRVVLLALVDLAKGFVEFRLLQKKESLLADFLRTHPPAREDAPLRGWRRALFRLFLATMPLHKWMITRRAGLYYDELKRSQWLPPERMRELQERKLRRLVHHAYHHVGYYREAMDQRSLRPADIATLEDLGKLPLLDKAQVRESLYFDLLSDNHDKRRILKVSTSGSTGEPFVCYADQHQLEIRWAATLRSLEWTGWRFGDRQARLWHQTIGMSWHQVLRERIDAWLSRRIFIPAFEMSEKDVERAARRLHRHRPVLIDGYAECFHFLADYARRHGALGIHPRGLVSSAQVLPEESRQSIEQAFSTRVFDKYGSREFSGLAYECEAHDGHHVVGESYVVEVLKDGRPAAPGELGEVVVTDLNNLCLPFIRYRIGDLAVALDPGQPCPCGRGLPRLGRIEGRVQSMIVGADGHVVPGSLFPHLFKDYDFVIRQFQVLQETPGAVRLKVVKAARFDETVFDEALAILRRYLGESTRIDVEFVDAIPMVRTGKRQVSMSRVKIDFQELQGRSTGS